MQLCNFIFIFYKQTTSGEVGLSPINASSRNHVSTTVRPQVKQAGHGVVSVLCARNYIVRFPQILYNLIARYFSDITLTHRVYVIWRIVSSSVSQDPITRASFWFVASIPPCSPPQAAHCRCKSGYSPGVCRRRGAKWKTHGDGLPLPGNRAASILWWYSGFQLGVVTTQ